LKAFRRYVDGMQDGLGRLARYVREKGLVPTAVRLFEKLRAYLAVRQLYPGGHRREPAPGEVGFVCNVCGRFSSARPEALQREGASCTACESSVRQRAIVYMLSMELFGRDLALPDFPARPDIKGLGMSDWKGFARPLAGKLGYVNTYYHREPKLDILAPDTALYGTLDFLISSDVFEHIPPPVSPAFENAKRLLKPAGVFIFTVPYIKEGDTVEHFPGLYRYEIVDKVLRNVTREGVVQEFDGLVFHVGPGLTLEMRMFSESSLLAEFAKAGFGRVRFYREDVPGRGIYWHSDTHLPIAARG
jgi:SAM-dependent methyltransferase